VDTVKYLINEQKCDVNPQTLEKTPLYIATNFNQDKKKQQNYMAMMD